MHKTTPFILILSLLMLTSTACRYMDSDLALDDEAFAASLDGSAPQHITMEDAFFMGGLGLRGTGTSGGCGYGYSSWGHGSRGSIVVHAPTQAPTIGGGGVGALGALALAGGSRGVDPEEEDEAIEEEVMSAEDAFILNHTTVEVLAREGAL